MTSAAPITAIVYQATNRVNGHRYIGFTTQGFEVRKKQHLYDARKGKTYRFQRAIRKYGAENFDFAVMADFDGDEDLAKVYEYEAISAYKPEYNLCAGGEGGRLADETRAKISAAHTGKKYPNRQAPSAETRAKISATLKGREKPWLRGKPLSDAAKARIGAAHKGHKNYNTKPMSEETRKKLSAAAKGKPVWITGVGHSAETRERMRAMRKAEHARATPERQATQKALGKHLSDSLRKPIVCVTDGRLYESAAAAARYYGNSKAAVANVAKGRFKSVGGRVFKYVQAPE